MGDPRGFVKLRRATARREPPATRVLHWQEFDTPLDAGAMEEQGARCMDCGVPFCQGHTGCPIHNSVPEWNDLVYRGHWREAFDALHATNNFPELTGRLCPAPCESACVLGLIGEPVAIRHIEQAIADRGFADGWVRPRPPHRETGKRVAVVGSGPAGLAAAQQLRRAGHSVTVFEKAERAGGLLRYGIPDFKLDKRVLDMRLDQMRAEGVAFRLGVNVGRDFAAHSLRMDFDAVLLTGGAERSRDLEVPGRGLGGIHQAMAYLSQQNRRNAGEPPYPDPRIDARGRRVVIIGGGDTGSDCAGTAIRQGARSVRQFELLPQPPQERAGATPWPLWPMKLRTSYAHEEGAAREWSMATTAFVGDDHVRALRTVRVEARTQAGGSTELVPVAGSEAEIEADLVLLAMGFTGPDRSPLLEQLATRLDARGSVETDDGHRTSVDGVFAAGDMRRGPSLIVWAIREGRDAAAAIDRYLV